MADTIDTARVSWRMNALSAALVSIEKQLMTLETAGLGEKVVLECIVKQLSEMRSHTDAITNLMTGEEEPPRKISFGDVVSAVIEEIGVTTYEIPFDEWQDPDATSKHYKRNVADRLRDLFDQAEAQKKREAEAEGVQAPPSSCPPWVGIRERDEREKARILEVIRDIIKNEPEVRAAVREAITECKGTG